MDHFDHEKLHVYQAAIRFVSLAQQIIEAMPRGKAHLSDELDRASTSIAFNIAEGAGEFSRREKHRFYRMARRSATESAAILDVCRSRQLVDRSLLDQGRQLLLEIVKMLTTMVRGRDRARVSSGSKVGGQGLGQGQGQGFTPLTPES